MSEKFGNVLGFVLESV